MRVSKESKGLKLPPPNTVNSPFTFSIVWEDMFLHFRVSRFKTSTLSSILSVNEGVPPLIYNSPLIEAQACPFLLGDELGILDTRPVNIFVNQKTIILLRCEVVFEQDFFQCQTKQFYTSNKSINTLMCSVHASNLV